MQPEPRPPMPTATTLDASGPTAATAQAAMPGRQSAKMVEAQAYFQKIVKQELQVLLTSGLDRDVAVKMLLHRIVASTDEPEEVDVRRVMKQFQMNHDDAVRALIVKQEIGRLKRQGLDAFAAIEELTRKMQRISVPSSTDDEPHAGESKVDVCDAPMIKDIPQYPGERERAEKDEAAEKVTADPSTQVESDPEDKTSETHVVDNESDAAKSPLSLCQRIDQVSISTVPVSPERTREISSPTSRTIFALFSASSRKRRVQGDSSSSAERDPSVSPRDEMASSSSHRTANNSTHRPMSPTFRFPLSKKQKLWDEVSESMLSSISRKTVSVQPPASPTAISAHDDEDDEAPPHSTVTINDSPSTAIGKRQRMTGSSSPLYENVEFEDAMIHITKRHRK